MNGNTNAELLKSVKADAHSSRIIADLFITVTIVFFPFTGRS
jgi:hypothetical protein